MEMLPFAPPLSPALASRPSSLSEKCRYYAPLTPSPLNPNIRRDDAPQPSVTTTPIPAAAQAPSSRPPKRRSSLPPNPGARRPADCYASPTEYLLRQKAAAAWRSETLRHQHHHHARFSQRRQAQLQLQSQHQRQPQLRLPGPGGAKEEGESRRRPRAVPQSQRTWEWRCHADAAEKARMGRRDWAGATGDAVLSIPIPDELVLLDKQEVGRGGGGGGEEEDEDDEGNVGLLVWPSDKRPAAPYAASGDRGLREIDFAAIFPPSPPSASASASASAPAYGPPASTVTVMPGGRTLRLPARTATKMQRQRSLSRIDVAMRRVLLVMGFLVGLGLVHSLVRAIWTRPPAVDS